MKIFDLKVGIITSFLLFLVSCGGVIGHISIYKFGDVSPDKLEKAIQDLYKNDTTLLKKDKSMYSQVKNSNGSYYFVVFEDNKKYLFRCDLIDSEYTVSTELSLTTAVEWGRVMVFSFF